MNSAVFLDRDGVLNRGYVQDGKSYAPKKVADFKLLPYAASINIPGFGFLQLQFSFFV